MSIIEQIDLKFTSGNDVGVSRVVLTKEEWDQVKALLPLIRDDEPQIGDYIPYKDDECPLHSNVAVECLLSNGSVVRATAGTFDWTSEESEEIDNIIGYKII